MSRLLVNDIVLLVHICKHLVQKLLKLLHLQFSCIALSKRIRIVSPRFRLVVLLVLLVLLVLVLLVVLVVLVVLVLLLLVVLVE